MEQDGDLLPDQQITEIVRGPHHRIRNDHQPATVQQCAKDLPHGDVEDKRPCLRPHLARPGGHVSERELKGLSHIGVRNGHTLGNTGRSRRVNRVRNVIGCRGEQRRMAVNRAGGVVFGIIELDDGDSGSVKPCAQLGGRDSRDRHGVGQHELQSCIRHRGIDRQIRRSGLENREDRHDRVVGARHQERHRLTRTGTIDRQQIRQSRCGLIQLAIRSRAALERQRHRLRGTIDLLGERLRNGQHRLRPPRQHLAIAPAIKLLVLAGLQHIECREPLRGIGNHRRQHPLEPLEYGLDLGRIELVGVEFDANSQLMTG